MIDNSKITLSAKELEMVCDTNWILTKQVIVQKVYQLFGHFSTIIQQQIIGKVGADVSSISPKISKGENYRHLPYVMLDYPRLFTKNETTALRTFFWWGNFVSINLHLAGPGKASAEKLLIEHFIFFQQNDYFICVGDTPWDHYFEEDNYLLIQKLSIENFQSILASRSFVKIAKKIPLQEWGKLSVFLVQAFKEMLPFLVAKHQADETNLLPGIPTIDSGL